MSEAVLTRIAETRKKRTALPESRRAVLIAVFAAVGYLITAKIGFAFALQPGSVSTLWMPNSILLAALLLTSRRWWWFVILAVSPAHFVAELQSGVPTMMVLSWFVSNSAQALIAAIVICRLVDGPLRFDRLKDVGVFVLCGAFLAPFLASFLDIAFIELNGFSHGSYWEIWRVRFLSNVLATLTLVPVIINWTNSSLNAMRTAPLKRWVEAGLWSAGLFAVGSMVFISPQQMAPSLIYWPLPFLLWATVRFGPLGASTALLIVMFLAIFGATHGSGPFVANSPAMNALSIQWFLIVVSIPLMGLAAVIEERRRAEETARQDEDRLTLALSAAQMGTWEWDIKSDTGRWSDETKRMFGLSPEQPEASTEEFFQMIHPEDRLFVELALNRAINEGTPYEAEFRISNPDGAVHWVRGRGKVLRDESGQPSCMIGLNADITESKNAEQALLDSNERNQAILRALPDMMFLQTRDGVYVDYFARDPGTLFVPPETFIGKKVRDVLPPALAEQILDCVSKLAGDETQVLEYSLQIGGEERHFEARLVAAEGDKVLSIIRDVTEARRAGDALRQGERKLLESNRQIRALAARLMSAQDSERTRIAHLLHDDISQNVAALGVSLSRLKRDVTIAPAQMIAELDRLGGQTNDLTTELRRLSHQLQPEVLEHLGLVATLESQAKEFGHEEQIRVNFAAHIGSDPFPLDVSVCLYRVALEALRNVSRHSGADSVSITLSQAESFLTLEVSDSGCGFEVEKAKRESGIGLASAEERVKLLQGTFEIRSKLDEGTTLIARVPVARQA